MASRVALVRLPQSSKQGRRAVDARARWHHTTVGKVVGRRRQVWYEARQEGF